MEQFKRQIIEQNQGDGYHLKYRLEFSHHLGSNNFSVVGSNHTAAIHHRITGDHDENRNKRNHAAGKEQQKQRCCQKLVRNWIGKLAECRNHVTGTGNVSIQSIRQCRNDIDGKGSQIDDGNGCIADCKYSRFDAE